MNRYFTGSPSNMGQVQALPAPSFAELVANVIHNPVLLSVSKVDLHCLPEEEQGDAKKCDYLVPAVFKSSPCQRKTENATCCNLVFVDIDDPKEAQSILDRTPAALLGDLASVVYHTARSLPGAPRLRVMVDANEVPVNQYANAVNAIAAMLGLKQANRESLIPVQAMYFPVTFSDDTSSPIVYENPKGTQYVYAPTVTLPCSPTPAAPTDEDVANIEFLREPMDGITTEVIKDALTKIDPDCSMQKWVEYGMGLKHQFGEAGYELWDEWSSTGKKYKGDQETRKRWDSFRGATKDRPPITLRTVVKSAVEAGWDNAVFDEQVYEKTKEWIMSDSRSTEELLDTGAVRIAKIAGVLSPGRKAALVNTLAKAMRKDGMKGPTPSEILKDIKRISKLNGSTKGEEPPPDWTTGMAFMTAPNLFFRYNDNRKMRPEVVNQIYISPDPELRPSDYLIHTVGIPVVEQTIYDPSQPPGVIFHNGVPFINTYQQSYAPSDYTHLAEASRLIVAHAHNMMGKWEYARTLINFTATLVQQPGRKIRWAPLIQGGVGCGKGLWGKFISCAIGATNVQQLSGENILEGTHNSYATGAQLSNINELDTFGYANRSRTADKMKPMITDDEISVRNLYEPVRTVKNTTNYIIFTNRMNALAVHSDDRRYFVVNSPLQLPEDIAALGANYFEEMYRFTQQHPGAIRAFFESWPIDDDFNPDGRAPVTPFLREMAEMSCSPLMSEVRHLLEDQPHPLLRKDLVSLTALRSLIAAERVASFSDQALSAVLRECGYTSVGRHVVEGAKHSLWTRRLVGDAATVAQQRMDYL